MDGKMKNQKEISSSELIPVYLYDQLVVSNAIMREVQKGNLEFAKQLKKDALEYLKEKNMETEWLETIVWKDEK